METRRYGIGRERKGDDRKGKEGGGWKRKGQKIGWNRNEDERKRDEIKGKEKGGWKEREKRRLYGQVRENRERRDATGSSVYSHTSGELGNLPLNQGGRRGGGG